MQPVEIKKDIFWVGCVDYDHRDFHGYSRSPEGSTYNAYLIRDEKNVLMDTVYPGWAGNMLCRIAKIMDPEKIDYIVCNHMEPDHSGSLALLRQYYPDVQVIGNKKTFGMMQGFYHISGNEIEVKNADTLSLGQHTLRFTLTPMVHWPETMMTLDETTHTLFAGDAFGCFGALNGGVIDNDICCDTFWMEMTRYYSNIVGKYGTPVQNALKKLAGVQIDYICSTHGPVWHQYVERVVGIYDRLSRYEAEPGLVICYGTMYGNTERMAEVIAQAASKAGVKNIVLYNVSKTHHSYILRDVFRYKGLIVGAPTYNNGLYHEMDVLLEELANRDIKNRLLGWFGSHAWASKAVAKIGEWNETRLHYTPVGTPVDMKQGMSDEVRQQCQALGEAMAAALKA